MDNSMAHVEVDSRDVTRLAVGRIGRLQRCEGPPRVRYAPATINHNLAVLRSFYDDRLAVGSGRVINPVPSATARDGQRPGAHHNPMQPFAPHGRAPLRQKTPMVAARGLPDGAIPGVCVAVLSHQAPQPDPATARRRRPRATQAHRRSDEHQARIWQRMDDYLEHAHLPGA